MYTGLLLNVGEDIYICIYIYYKLYVSGSIMGDKLVKTNKQPYIAYSVYREFVDLGAALEGSCSNKHDIGLLATVNRNLVQFRCY